MSVAAIVLAAAAVPIGMTGTWSPCGFSMVETIGMRGHDGARATTLAACATFAPGAVAGGVATFGVLAAAGEAVHGIGGSWAYLIAAAIAAAAAAAEARGVRIVPQIRRQLPESWRWRMPLPLASGLYGILLGLGFTTFVLSFGAWALAAISFALGDPRIGAVIGLAFGVGRALPIVVLAPLADRPVGIRCVELMAERPALYTRIRLGDGLLLVVAAITLGAVAASAAPGKRLHGADPSAAGGALAYQKGQAGRAVLRRGGHSIRLPGREPAIGGRYAVVRIGDRLSIRARSSLHELGHPHGRGAWAIAISRHWLAYAQTRGGRDLLTARPLKGKGVAGPPRVVARVRHPARLGHAGLDGNLLVFGVATRSGNRIVWRRLGSGHGGVVARSHRAALCCASVRNGSVLYVRSIRARQSAQAVAPPPLLQHLVLDRIGRHARGRTIYERRGEHGTLYSTALSARRAYATILHRRSSRIVPVGR